VRFVNHHKIKRIRGPEKRTSRDASSKLAMNQKNAVAAKIVGVSRGFLSIDAKEVVKLSFPLS
jgi:hypothetical protein